MAMYCMYYRAEKLKQSLISSNSEDLEFSNEEGQKVEEEEDNNLNTSHYSEDNEPIQQPSQVQGLPSALKSKKTVKIPDDYVSSIGNDQLRIPSINSPRGVDRIIYSSGTNQSKNNVNSNVNSYMPPAHLSDSRPEAVYEE